MFTRVKKSGKYEYLQVVHNEREGKHVRQRVLATLGRLDYLQASGQVDAVIASMAKYAQHTAVLNARRSGDIPPAQTTKIGPALVFEKLWDESGVQTVLGKLLAGRRFEFPVERALFLTVLHRLFAPGSDRAAEVWCRRYAIKDIQGIDLHHLYRAMAWLGEPLPLDKQFGATPFSPRCTKDLVEEALFDTRRDLFTEVDLVFFDTTSIYFEGEGGQSIGERGNTKDHRPDLKQMIVGVVLDNEGRPLCCEMWPGNTTDVTTLIPVVRRLRTRFHIGSICIVADRGMISKGTIDQLGENGIDCRFILGARMRSVNEVKKKALSRAGRYHVVYGPKETSKDPSPLKVKEVWVDKHRYIICYNEDRASKDRADREAIVAGLLEQLRRGDKSLVGNKGYRKYLTSTGQDVFQVNEAKIREEARYDGKWVLRTDLDISPDEVALKYKQLWMVETIFRSMKSILETRPIFHKRDETIRGHVFCSFLALVLIKELFDRMDQRGWDEVEWARLRDNLDDLEEITVRNKGKTFIIRSQLQGDAGKAIQAARVRLGPAVRFAD